MEKFRLVLNEIQSLIDEGGGAYECDLKALYNSLSDTITEYGKQEASEKANDCTSENSLHKHIVTDCACSVDETTGWTTVKCCNICGRPLKDQNWHCG